MLRELLEMPGVEEICELRGTIGLMAFHGGNLERTTDAVAREVADRTGASFYAVLQAPPLRKHIPSTAFRPEDSLALSSLAVSSLVLSLLALSSLALSSLALSSLALSLFVFVVVVFVVIVFVVVVQINNLWVYKQHTYLYVSDL